MTKTVEAEAEVVLAFEPRKPGTRRRYTLEQKRMLLDESATALGGAQAGRAPVTRGVDRGATNRVVRLPTSICSTRGLANRDLIDTRARWPTG